MEAGKGGDHKRFPEKSVGVNLVGVLGRGVSLGEGLGLVRSCSVAVGNSSFIQQMVFESP